MTPDEKIENYLAEAARDIITFIKGCSSNLSGIPEQAMIASVAQYMDIFRKGMTSCSDEHSCVSRRDIVECQIAAMRSCILDLERIILHMNQEDTLN